MVKNLVKVDDNQNSRKIYILLSQTSTILANIIKIYTKAPYAHTSIALDEDLQHIYSFGRKGMYNYFNNGFVEEDIENGVYARYKNTKCSVYSLAVSEEQYNRIKAEIKVFQDHKSIYSYSLLGLIGVAISHPIVNEEKYFCSQFVAYILEKSGVGLFEKHCALVRPIDFLFVMNKVGNRIYKGRLCDYRKMRRVKEEKSDAFADIAASGF